MFRKAPYIVGVIFLLGSVAFFNRSWLEIGYLKGKLVAFPSSRELSSKDAKTILIVGSEGTKNQQLNKKVKNVCPQLRVSMKVNRYTNLEWQEAHELHGLMRKRSFDIVLVETQSSDFSPENRDLIARFETTAKKSGSKLFYWSTQKIEHAPTHFIDQMSTLKTRICPTEKGS